MIKCSACYEVLWLWPFIRILLYTPICDIEPLLDAAVSNPTALVLTTPASTTCGLYNNLILSFSSASPLCNLMVSSLSGAGNLATHSSCKFLTTTIVGVTTYTSLKASTPANNGGPTTLWLRD